MANKFTTEKYAAIKLDTREMKGPIYAVERTHGFSGQASTSKKTEKGHQAEAQLEVLNYPVMGVEVRKHGFKDKAPASYHIEKLVGPTFEVEHSHHFERDKVLSEKVITLTGPAFDLEHGHKYPHKGKLDIITEKAPVPMTGPVLPVQASNKYQGNASIPKVRTNKVMAAPAYRGIDIQHNNQYQPEMEPGWKEPPMDVPMAGPKLPGIEASHAYGPVPTRRAPMHDLPTPVYGVKGDNKYSIVTPRVKGDIVMAGPKYVEEKSHYNPQTEKVKGELAMCGPVWQCTDSNNKYNPETKRVEGEISLNGPVYRNIDGSGTSKYPDKGKLDITGGPAPHEMFGPVLPVTASNKYQGPMKEQPKVHPGKMMSAPSYRGIDIQHNNQYQPTMEPGWKENVMDIPMAGPKLPGIEQSHTYGPVPTRRAPMHDLPTPVYGVSGDNQYSVVNPRVKAQPIMAGPKYVEERSHYNPASEKVKGQLLMCGPVWQDVDSSSLKYLPDTKKVDGLLSMCAPVYRGVDDSSKYCPQTERKEVVKEVFGPVLPVESKNKYQPMETASSKVRTNKLMAGPAYRGIDIQHSSSYAPVNPHM